MKLCYFTLTDRQRLTNYLTLFTYIHETILDILAATRVGVGIVALSSLAN